MPNQPIPIVATGNAHLSSLIAQWIETHGPACDLNHIDVSRVEDMDLLFHCSSFNGDISRWDTRNVRSAIRMFELSSFNGDISRWNMGSLRFANDMFKGAKFSGDISAWAFAQPGPGNLVGAFFSEHFRSDMPRLKTFGTPTRAVLHPEYKGSFHDEYTLDMATHLFHESEGLARYLANTAAKGLHRLHIEYLLTPYMFDAKPDWCPEPLFSCKTNAPWAFSLAWTCSTFVRRRTSVSRQRLFWIWARRSMATCLWQRNQGHDATPAR